MIAFQHLALFILICLVLSSLQLSDEPLVFESGWVYALSLQEE